MSADPIRPGKPEEFAIENYKGWLESMHRSEEIGEKRLEFFIAVATAIFGAVGLLAKRGDAIDFDQAAVLAVYALPALLLFGVLTFLRMLRRDVLTDLCKEQLDKTRAWFAIGVPDAPWILDKKPGSRPLSNGGLTVVMMVINTLLAGAWLGVFAWLLGGTWLDRGSRIVISAFVFCLGLVLGWVVGLWCRGGFKWPSLERQSKKSNPR
jgi:hypothetical protein